MGGPSRAFAQRPKWVDYVLAADYGDHFPAYPLRYGVPGGLPMVGFPEISMHKASPWGGYGANPLPQHLQALWDQAGHALSGGFPYSEGIFEDLNKAICAQFYWDPDKPAWDTVREYVTYEYGPAVVTRLASWSGRCLATWSQTVRGVCCWKRRRASRGSGSSCTTRISGGILVYAGDGAGASSICGRSSTMSCFTPRVTSRMQPMRHFKSCLRGITPIRRSPVSHHRRERRWVRVGWAEVSRRQVHQSTRAVLADRRL